MLDTNEIQTVIGRDVVWASATGTKVSFVPNSPVLTVTHSGRPLWSSRYTWPAEPIFSPSLP